MTTFEEFEQGILDRINRMSAVEPIPAPFGTFPIPTTTAVPDWKNNYSAGYLPANLLSPVIGSPVIHPAQAINIMMTDDEVLALAEEIKKRRAMALDVSRFEDAESVEIRWGNDDWERTNYTSIAVSKDVVRDIVLQHYKDIHYK